MLREVGFVLLWLFYAEWSCNGLTVSPHFRANLRCVWFGCCYVTVKDRFHGVSGLSDIEHCIPRRKNPEQNGKRGCAQIFAHPCESVASTLDGHKFLVRTPIRVFLDSTESSLSPKFYKMKCSAKMWAEHWVGSWTVEEWSIMVSRTYVFGTGLYLKCLGLRMA